jgi:lysophospholipase L1-like esterase
MRLQRQKLGPTQIGLAAVLAAFAFWGGTPKTLAAATQSCATPADIYEYEPYLPRTLGALEKGGPITIVAVGGASTRGRAAGDDSRAWPARLGQALAARFPSARITVLNRGVARETAAQMVARFDKDVFAFKPDLVIWETATNDAVSATDVDAFRETLQTGIERLRAAVPEVMFMNPQFSRLSEFVVNFNRYTTILRGVADLSELPLFPRHEIMRYWADRGVFNFRVTGREQRRELAIHLYACIGAAVADMIVRRPPVQVR